MQYLTQEELKRMMLLSYKRIEEKKEEINKINVFPVPDQDTGGNLAKTLEGIKKAIENRKFKDLDDLSEKILNGALNAAQGNAGVIFTGFLAGFLPVFQNKNPIGIKKLAEAMQEGVKRARKSIQNPKEGTILDVMETAATTFSTESEENTDIIKIFKKAIEKASRALLETREKMEVLKKANVVDAGGLGYLIILESWLEALEKPQTVSTQPLNTETKKIRRFIHFLSYRYEIVSLIKNPKYNEKNIREKLKSLGNCLDIVQVSNKVKIHIHTDYPEKVREIINNIGEVESIKEEDMAKEIIGEDPAKKTSIGIVTDDVSCILPKILERYQIEMVSCKLDWEEGEKLPGKDIYEKMEEAEKRGIKTFPKTSQAPPSSYLKAFKKQLERFEKVLCITVSSKLSGCFNSAHQAEAMVDKPMRVFILDSLNAGAGQTLLVLKAIELIQEKKELPEIIKILKGLIPKTHLYAALKDPKWLEAGGRITRAQANWIRRMKKIHFHPLLQVKEGAASKAGIVWAKDISEALFKKILKESQKIRKKGIRIRTVINHANNLKGAEKLKEMLKEEIKAEVSFISLAPAVVGAHTGPGTLIAAWMPLQ